MPAVPSGLNVILSSPRSAKLYVSFDTTSLLSPSGRVNTSDFSIIGNAASSNPYKSEINLALLIILLYFLVRGF